MSLHCGGVSEECKKDLPNRCVVHAITVKGAFKRRCILVSEGSGGYQGRGRQPIPGNCRGKFFPAAISSIVLPM